MFRPLVVTPSIWTAGIGVVAVACALTGFSLPPKSARADGEASKPATSSTESSAPTEGGSVSDAGTGVRPQLLQEQDQLTTVRKAKKPKSRYSRKLSRPQLDPEVDRIREPLKQTQE